MISSTFDSDADGWTPVGTSSSIVHQATGGNPDGFIRVWDENAASGPARISAPSEFLGDISVFNDEFFSFDARRVSGANGGPPNGLDIFGTVLIKGGGAEASADLAPTAPPSVAWVTYTGQLNAANWGVDAGTWALILSNVTEIVIFTEAFGGRDSVGIDNVVVHTPLPAAIWLLLTALGGLGLIGRRRSASLRRSSV